MLACRRNNRAGQFEGSSSMRITFRYFATTVMYALLSGAFGLLVSVFLGDQDLSAQASKEAPPTQLKPKTPAKTPAAKKSLAQGTPAPATTGPVRTETVSYDAWTVNCRDTADGKTKKVCSANLAMIMQQDNRQIPLGAWIIARNTEGALLSVVQTPQIDVGVLIAKGIELKLGEGKPRKINFVACNPQRGEGTMPMGHAPIKESTSIGPLIEMSFMRNESICFFANANLPIQSRLYTGVSNR